MLLQAFIHIVRGAGFGKACHCFRPGEGGAFAFIEERTFVPDGNAIEALLRFLFASEPLVATSDSVIAQSEQSIIIQGTAQRIKPGTLLI